VRRSIHIVWVCALSMALTAWPRQAAAQPIEPVVYTPNVEITGGVQVLHIPDETYPFGFNLDLSGPAGAHGRVRWVGEAGMAQDRPIDLGDTLRFIHVGAGVRVTAAQRLHATPYFQVLGGIANARADHTGFVDSAWGPMVQPGVGVSVPLNRFFAVIGQGDYRVAIFRSQVDNEFRFTVGARFMLW